MIIETSLNIGDIVYLITDLEQKRRIITGIKIEPNNSIKYLLSFGETETWHYQIEISIDINILMKILN